MNISIAIADTNELYLERLLEVLQEYEELSVSIFTDVQFLEKTLQLKNFDIVLFDPDIAEEKIDFYNTKLSVCLYSGEAKNTALYKEYFDVSLTDIKMSRDVNYLYGAELEYTEIIPASGNSVGNGEETQTTDTDAGKNGGKVSSILNNLFGSDRNVPADKVGCIVYLIDKDENPMGGMRIELHSTPQNSITDTNGYARFNPIDFGNHTIYVNTENGEKVAKNFNLVSGNAAFLEGNTVTAKPGTCVMLTVSLDGTVLELEGVTQYFLKTGDSTHLTVWLVIMLAALSCVVIIRKSNFRKKAIAKKAIVYKKFKKRNHAK